MGEPTREIVDLISDAYRGDNLIGYKVSKTEHNGRQICVVCIETGEAYTHAVISNEDFERVHSLMAEILETEEDRA